MQGSSTRSRLRTIATWLPVVLFALVLLFAWGAFLGAGMGGVVAWLALMLLLPLVGLVVLLASGAIALWKRRLSAPVLTSMVLALMALWPGAWNVGALQMGFPASLEHTQPTATVRLPSNERLRVLWGGDRLATNRHAFTPDQRWAYDMVVEPALHGSTKLEDYGCWGTRVVAPAQARVHVAHDGEPDAVPGGLTNNTQQPLGNHVVLELPGSTFLLLAHLQQGSVAVKQGDVVSEGQALGRCGNSGNTSEPHIHIHHQRQDPAHFPVNFAEGLPLFFRDHDGAAMPEGGVEVRDDKPVPLGAVVRHTVQASANEP